MALQTINIGNIANDGTGDDLREAFIKVNNNFENVNSLLLATDVTAENLGTGLGLFAQKSDDILQFKGLRAGGGVTLTETGTSITITGNSGLTELIVLSDSGSVLLPGGDQLLSIYGGQNISTRVAGTGFIIDLTGDNLVEKDPAPTLSGPLNANSQNIIGANTISALDFIGNLTGLVHGIDIRTVANALNNFDLGPISNITNVLEFIVVFSSLDFGTFVAPSSAVFDGGAFA